MECTESELDSVNSSIISKNAPNHGKIVDIHPNHENYHIELKTSTEKLTPMKLFATKEQIENTSSSLLTSNENSPTKLYYQKNTPSQTK